MKLSLQSIIYNILIHAALPVILVISWRKCQKAQHEKPALKNCFKQKFGFLATGYQKNSIVIHAVSLGETLSVLPLIQQLQKNYPDTPITLTNGSVRGAKQLVEKLPAGIQYSFLPLDYPFAVHHFLKTLQPKLVVIVETEIWPNLIHACHRHSTPCMVINARLKDSSMLAYKKFGGQWLSNSLNHLEAITCQFETDKNNFLQLGINANNLKTTGNLKFDITLSAQQKNSAQTWRTYNLEKTETMQNRFCWVAASTHEHEEALMLRAHHELLKTLPNALLIIVPRQAQRFKEVQSHLEKHRWHHQLRSNLPEQLDIKQNTIDSDTQVLLADSVGEMMHWMGVCNAAFIGGSMVNFGGHNILEPAAWHKPILSGPYYQNLAALYQVFIDAQAIQICKNPEQLSKSLLSLSNPEQAQIWGQLAYQNFTEHSGALDKTLHIMQQTLKRQI